MKIFVEYGFDTLEFNCIKDAEEKILERIEERLIPTYAWQEDESSKITYYGCEWSVKLTKLP